MLFRSCIISYTMENKNKILEKIFDRPTYKFHLRELARVTKLNPNTVSSLISLLVKESLVKKEKRKHLIEVFFNFGNPSAIWVKKLFNLNRLQKSGIIDFLVDKYNPSSISLIGSYSRGEDYEISDIDIVVISNNKSTFDLAFFEKKLKRKIHLIVSSNRDFSKEFNNNLINGIVLWGVLSND